VLDDNVVAGKRHYPCGVYLREGGKPIGEINPCMRRQRAEWMMTKDTHNDEICRQFCSDMYVDYNNKFEEFLQSRIATLAPSKDDGVVTTISHQLLNRKDFGNY